MNDCILQDLITVYPQGYPQPNTSQIYFFSSRGNFISPPSYNPSKFYIPVNIFSPCRKTQPLDALETPYFEPKKKAIATN